MRAALLASVLLAPGCGAAASLVAPSAPAPAASTSQPASAIPGEPAAQAHVAFPVGRVGLSDGVRPGMVLDRPGHLPLGGGPGPTRFDAVTALEEWVWKGKAPEQLTATHSTAGKVDRSRPLCVYPKVARYKGTGSIDEAANFTCVAPPAPPAPRPR